MIKTERVPIEWAVATVAVVCDMCGAEEEAPAEKESFKTKPLYHARTGSLPSFALGDICPACIERLRTYIASHPKQ